MDKGFEIIDHTADIGVIAYGADFKQVFANAASGLFSLIADLDDVKEDTQREIELSTEDEDFLLVEWLNELIYIFDVEHIIFSRFEIDDLTSNKIKARCFGEELKHGKYTLKREIKAATYHMMRIHKDNSGYSVQVIFDV